MGHLPFLVVHGALVWKIAVALGGLGGAALLRWHGRVRERRIVARSLTLYGNASSAPLEGTVVLRGHLRGGGVSTSTGDERRGGPLTSRTDAGAWLDVGGDRIALPGDALVIRGTSATARARGRTFALADGDEVVALGTCARATSTADYRDAAGGWVMTPLPNRTSVELLAARPAIVARPIGPVSTAWRLFGFSFATYIALVLASPIVAWLGGNTWAAAMPLGRDRALRELQSEASWSADPAERETVYDLIEVRSGCRAAFETLYDDGRLDRALATAQRCDLRDGESRTLIQLGYYGIAAPLSDGPDALLGDIGAGRWGRAAATFHATGAPGACALAVLRFRAGLDKAVDSPCETREVAPMTVDEAYRELDAELTSPVVLDAPAGSPAAAVLAVYRGDYDTAEQIATNLHAPALASLIELRSGRMRDGIDEVACKATVLRQPTNTDTFTALSRADHSRCTPALHALTFHPGHGADLPATMIREAAYRRDVARYFDDTDEATRWQGVIDRHLAMLADPDRARLIASRFGAD